MRKFRRRGDHVRERSCSLRVGEEDGRMAKAARFGAFFIAIVAGPAEWLSTFFKTVRHPRALTFSLLAFLVLLCAPLSGCASGLPRMPRRQNMQDAHGHSIAVDGNKFSASIHGSLKCNNCHADIKEYPHPDHIAKVDCKTCHADEASSLRIACTPFAKSIPAPAATEMPTRSFRKLIRDRQCIHSIFPKPADNAIATAEWPRRRACPAFIRTTSIRSTASH